MQPGEMKNLIASVGISLLPLRRVICPRVKVYLHAI